MKELNGRLYFINASSFGQFIKAQEITARREAPNAKTPEATKTLVDTADTLRRIAELLISEKIIIDYETYLEVKAEEI